MASQASSNLPRPHPAVLASLSLATVASLYYLYTSHRRLEAAPSGVPLRRSNAIRRSRTAEDREDQEYLAELDPDALEAHGDPFAQADDALTEASAQELELEQVQRTHHPQQHHLHHHSQEEDYLAEDDPQQRVEASRLGQLIFAITKNRAKNEGSIHRGITCDNCSRCPIVGVRYRCVNCPDFDLCEDCEALDPHTKSHVFYKIKVPAPWAGKQPLAPFYPGRPWEMPPELSHAYKKELHDELGMDMNWIEGLYQQFSCLANRTWPDDPKQLYRAIDYFTFRKCFSPQTSARVIPPPNVLHQRIFRYFDTDRNGFIGFEEFVRGVNRMHRKSDDEHRKNDEDTKQRIFDLFDMDEDGWITRKDIQRLVRAYNELSKDVILDHLRMLEDGESSDQVATAREHIFGGRSISSYFLRAYPDNFWPNSHSNFGKMAPPDENGDVNPAVEGVLLSQRDTINADDLIGGTWTSPVAELDVEAHRLVQGLRLRFLKHDEDITIRPGRDVPPWYLQTDSEGKRTLWVEFRPSSTSRMPFSGRTVFLPVGDAWYRHLKSLMSVNFPLSDVLREKDTRLSTEENARARAVETIVLARQQERESRLQEREKYEDFYLDRPTNPQDANELIGGTEASHIIAEVVEQALNEMLDAIFRSEEKVSLDIKQSEDLRKLLSSELAVVIDVEENSRSSPEADPLLSTAQDVQSRSPFGSVSSSEEDAKRVIVIQSVTDVCKREARPSIKHVFVAFESLFGSNGEFNDINFEAAYHAAAARRSGGQGPNRPPYEAEPSPDMTLPQFKPAEAAFDAEQEPVRSIDERRQDFEASYYRMLKRLATDEILARARIDTEQPWGAIDFEEFSECIDGGTERNVEVSRAYRWICGWFDFVQL